MNRRSIFKLFACAVAASAMEVCGWVGTVKTLASRPICLLDFAMSCHPARSAFNVFDEFTQSLPKEKFWSVQWVNIPSLDVASQDYNPLMSRGTLMAFESESETDDALAFHCMLNDMRKFTHSKNKSA